MNDRWTLFLGIAPGLERLLRAELTALGLSPEPYGLHGGVELVATTPERLWEVAHYSRLAGSLRLRLGHFQASKFRALQSGIRMLRWSEFARPNTPFIIKTQSKRSRLYHKGAIEERVLETLHELLGEPSPDVEPLNVFLRVINDKVRVSIDVIGEPMHRRGWRRHVGKAPLRETLAATLVRGAELDPARPLWDPFCGSGTLVIEAAAVGAPTNPSRRFAFESWPCHDAAGYRAFVDALPAPSTGDRPLIGSDIDPSEIDAARANVRDAGLEGACQFVVGDFDAVVDDVPSGSAILTNLPYGQRTKGGRVLQETLERFGAMLGRRPDLEPVFALGTRRGLLDLIGVPWTQQLVFSNRGVPVTLAQFTRK